jgi:hypothetical protein
MPLYALITHFTIFPHNDDDDDDDDNNNNNKLIKRHLPR